MPAPALLNLDLRVLQQRPLVWIVCPQDFQLLSLRLICKHILQNTPYYLSLDEERSVTKKDPKIALRRSLTRPRTIQASHNMQMSDVEELEGMYVPGEAVSLNLSLAHLHDACKIIHSRHNPGAYAFGKEMVRAVIGISLVQETISGLRGELVESSYFEVGDRVQSVKHGLGVVTRTWPDGRLSIAFDDGYSHNYKQLAVTKKITRAPDDAPPPPKPMQLAGAPSAGERPSERKPKRVSITGKRKGSVKASSEGFVSAENGRLLLYLNNDTWVGPDGAELEQIVRAAWEKGVEIVMVHENDPERNGCEFGHLFQTTPQSLIAEGIYKTIAIALHPLPHREVSLTQVAQACGAVPSKTKRRAESFYGRRPSTGGKKTADGRRGTNTHTSNDMERLQREQLKQFEMDEMEDRFRMIRGEKETEGGAEESLPADATPASLHINMPKTAEKPPMGKVAQLHTAPALAPAPAKAPPDRLITLTKTPLGLGCTFVDGDVVSVVKTDSQASRAGIRLGDQVLSINGESPEARGGVNSMLSRIPAGTSLKLELVSEAARQKNARPKEASVDQMLNVEKAATSSMLSVTPSAELAVMPSITKDVLQKPGGKSMTRQISWGRVGVRKSTDRQSAHVSLGEGAADFRGAKELQSCACPR